MKFKLIIITMVTLFVSAQLKAESTSAGQDCFSCISAADEQVIVEFNLQDFQLKKIEKNGIEYDRVYAGSSSYIYFPGKPELPRFTNYIAADNLGEIDFSILDYDEEIIRDVTVYPFQEAEFSGAETDEFQQDLSYYSSGDIFPESIVTISEPVILRDHRLVNLIINPFRYDPIRKELRICRKIQLKLEKTDREVVNPLINKNNTSSRFFEPLYRSLILNYPENDERTGEFQNPCYLFIYPDDNQVMAELSVLAEWKRQKGFEVHLVSTAETGTSLSAIKSFIQNAYDNWENPPEFLCLAGDAGGNYSIPTDHLDGGQYNGEGDHFYSLLAGNDFLADIFIGRLSFNSIFELQTIIFKILNYEKYPYLGNLDWYDRALMVGDPTDSGPSTITTNQSIVEMMSYHSPNYEFTEVYNTPWVPQMTTSLNNGVSYFHYRGFANMSGWFNTNTYGLNNGSMLPVVTHITCITGDFEGTNDCRSEAFLKAGTPGSSKGAIAAVGTATGNTHTCFNNIVSAGIFFGIFQDQIYNMGGALTRGKIALHENYPENPANHVHQFCYWNNLMGDPGMELWTGVPQTLYVTCPEQIAIGTNYLEVLVQDESGQPLKDAWVTAYSDDLDIFSTSFSGDNGISELILPATDQGEFQLTVTRHNFAPHLGSIEIVQSDLFINMSDLEIDDDNNGLSSGNGDGIINPGEIVEFNVELQNFGNTPALSVNAQLVSDNEKINIIDPFLSFGNIPSGTAVFAVTPGLIEFENSLLGGEQIEIELIITDSGGNNWHDLIFLTVSGPLIYITDYQVIDLDNNLLEPGETAEIVFTLENIGATAISNLSGILTTDNDFILIEDDSGYFGMIEPGEEQSNNTDTFQVTAFLQMINGTQITFQLHLNNPDGYNDVVSIVVDGGEVSVSDPLGPDAYGYYCYDDGDIGYYNVPQYQWIEIDPAYGGSGNVLPMVDYGNMGDNETIDLPFTIKFYGQDYNTITIGSDGWLCPGESSQTAFMNWHIPGVLGPSPLIAPFWDDLVIDDDSSVCWYFDESAHYLVIEWSRLKNEFNFSEETFQVIIYDSSFYPTSFGNSQVVFQYHTINNIDQGSYGGFLIQHGQFATVGIEDHTGTIGLEYTYNNSYPTAAKTLQNEMALLFTGPPINPEEPYLVLGQIIYDDENGNGEVDYNETVDMQINLMNLGNNPASGVSAELICNDPYISLLSAVSNYSDIPGNGLGYNQTPFSFSVAADCPDGHVIPFQLQIQSQEDEWLISFQVQVNAPSIQFEQVFVDDGINNILDPGETADVIIHFRNTGGSEASNVEVELNMTDPYLSLNSIESNPISLLPGEVFSISASISVDITAPIGYSATVEWATNADFDYQNNGLFNLYIAQVPVELVENFNQFPPSGWTTEGQGGWVASNSNFAGGNPPEAAFVWSSNQYTMHRLILPTQNTLGSTSLEFKLNNAIFTQDSNFIINLVTSTDGINWHIADNIPAGNTNPGQSVFLITNSDVGSPTFYLALEISGNTSGVFQFIFDDFILSAIETAPHGFISGNISLSGGNGNLENVEVTASGVDFTAYPDSEGNYALSLEPGVYDVSASLPGYISETVNGLIISENWEVVYQDFTLAELTIDFPPSGLAAISEGTDIILSWLIPGNETENSQHEENQIIDHEREDNKTRIKFTDGENERDLTGYRVYKNDVQIAFINNYLTTSYTDQHQPEGEYSYYVTALYTEGESEPSEVLVYNHVLPIPQNLVATETPNHLHVLLTWNAPETIEPVTCYRVYLNDGLLAEVTLMAYLHTNAPPGTLVYQVTAVYEDLESGAATAIIEHSDAFNPIIPVKTELMANYPNPFNPDTSIGFALKTSGEVVIQIFNLKGEKVKKLVNSYLETGFHNVIWDGCDENKVPVSSGIYLYQMKTEAYSSTRKMMLMK